MAKFGGFGGGANMQQLMKQAQKLQAEMQKAQEELKNSVVESSVGNGFIVLTMNGERKVESIKIKPEMIDVDDVEMLEDMIMAALNDANEQIDELTEEIMGPYSNLGGGLF